MIPTSADNQWYQVSLKLLLKNEKGECLVLKCRDDGSMSDYHDLPGGRIAAVEKDLPLSEIIKREIAEELGTEFKYALKSTKPAAIGRHSYPSKRLEQVVNLLLVLFEAEYIRGEIKISDEHQSYEWVKLTAKNLNRYFVRGPLELMQNYFSS